MFKKFGEMNIKERLNFGYTVVIVFMIIMGIVSSVALSMLNRKVNDFVNGSNVADESVRTCRIYINIAARNIREAALNDDPGSVATYEQKVQEAFDVVGSALQNLQNTGLIEDGLYQQYVDDITEWGTAGYEILNLLKEGKREEAKERIFNECVPALNNLVLISKELAAKTDELLQQSIKESKVIFGVSLGLIVAFVAIAIAVALQISRRIVKSIIEPLLEIEAVAKDLTEGHLHSNLEYNSRDEMGSLANSLRKATHILATYIDDISRVMNEFSNGNFDVRPEVEWRGDFLEILNAFMMFERSMSDTIKGIQSVAEQVDSESEQIAESSTDLADGATEQANVTHELAATIESVSGQVSVSAESAKEASKNVENIGTEIINGNIQVKEMVHSMDEISNASQEIRKIIDTINEIAAQTNLLALNASIEAARAGDAGKGFAVVANQVSILAAQSSEAAKESTVLIESSMNAVEKGIVIADETAKQLERVEKDSRVITEIVSDVAIGLESLSDSFVQINTGVDQINDVVQTNAATSEECAASSQEMSNLAGALKDLIRKFKVGDFND